MSYFGLLWKARTIEKCRFNYEKEKLNSIVMANAQVPEKSFYQRWRHYGYNTKKKILDFCRKRWPDGSIVSNYLVYLRTDQTFPNFVLKSILGFIGGIILTYLCLMFFVFQLSISLMHAAIMSSVMGVLLTLGLAFSYRVRCLVFLLIPQFFSRIGRYTLTCYALVLILTGPATNTLKNSEVLSESMACSQEQIKTSVKQINDSMKKPFNLMKDSIKTMIDRVKAVAVKINMTLLKINRLVLSIVHVLQSSSAWLESITTLCNEKLGTPYEHCARSLEEGLSDCRAKFGPYFAWVCNTTRVTQASCGKLKPLKAMCVFVNFFDGSIVATIKKKLKTFSDHIKAILSMDVRVDDSYSFSSNTSRTASQVAAGIVTEIRNRADPLLTWLSWSSCVTSLFLLLIIFRAKYYQNMYETRSRFDNRYITKEFRELDLKRLRQGRETVLPLNRRERTKYVTTTSFRLVASERVNLSRSVVLMMITTFKLLIHMIADYSLYWVLVTIRYHGRLQPPLYPGVPDAGIHITGTRPLAGILRALLGSLTIPIATPAPSLIPCLPNPYPPDFRRYTQIGVLIFLLWFFALFEPYGLRLRHVVMGQYRPERAKSRATWLYNHILRTRGSFMKYARRKLHRQYKYSPKEPLTFQCWLNSYIPYNWLRSLLGTAPKEPQCLLCGTSDKPNDPDTIQIRCETPNCLGVYCARCFSDIGQLCTICMSPADYGDLSDVSLEKGSSDESTDSDEDTESSYHHDPPDEPKPGPSNKCCANNSYEYIYYSKLEYKIQTSKPKRDYFGPVNMKSKTKEFQKESLTVSLHRQITLPMENNSEEFIEKTSVVYHVKQSNGGQNIINSTQCAYTGKANSNSYCHFHPKYPYTDDCLRYIIEKELPHLKARSPLGPELKISEHTSNNESYVKKFLDETRSKTRIISKRHKNIITMKNFEFTKNLRKRNINNSLSQFKIMLQISYYKVLDGKANVDKKRFYLDDNSLGNHHSSSKFEEKFNFKNIFKKFKSFNVSNITSSNKLPKQLRTKFKTILRQKRYIEKDADAVWSFMNAGFLKPMPYYEQSNNFLKNKCLRYTNSDIIRQNFLHNITVCSCTNHQNGPKKTKSKPKKEGKMKDSDVIRDEFKQHIIKCKSSSHCAKNIFVRWYQYWKKSKNKSTTRMVMMEYKKRNKKLRNDNKNHKRKKKYKNTGHDSKVIKSCLSNDDEATRYFRLTTYLEGQEWYKTNTDENQANNNDFDEKKVEIKPKPHNTHKSKLGKKRQEKVTEIFNIHPQTVDCENVTKSLNAGDLLCEHVFEKTKPLKREANEAKKKNSKLAKIRASIEKKSNISTKTVSKIPSTSEEVFIAEVHPSSDDKFKKEPENMVTINIKTGVNIKEKVEEILPEINNNDSHQNFDKLSEKRELEEEDEKNSVSDIKIKSDKSKDKTKQGTSKGSQQRLAIMKMLCSTIFAFKSNKATQKDLDKEVGKIRCTDKVLQTEQETKPQLRNALQQTDNFLQFVDKQASCSPSVTSRSCQCFIENEYQNECAFRIAKESTVREMCDAPIETVTTLKCTCATQYTSCTKEIGTNHRNCLIKIQNSAVQCSNIAPSLKPHELVQEKLPIKDSRYNIKGSESTETSTSDNSETSEATTTDTTVCSFITMEYANQNSAKRNDKKYKVIVVTKANRSTGTDRAEVCDVSTITSDWWSPLSEKKDMKEKEVAVGIKDRRVPRKKIVKQMREVGATTEGRIVKFKSKTRIIPTGDNEVLSPSRYLLESQRYYNELFTDMYQSQLKDPDVQHKGDHFRHDPKRNNYTIKKEDELYPVKQRHHRYRKVNLKQRKPTLLSNQQLWIVEGVTNHQSFNPYKLFQWQRHKCD